MMILILVVILFDVVVDVAAADAGGIPVNSYVAFAFIVVAFVDVASVVVVGGGAAAAAVAIVADHDDSDSGCDSV